jgi:Rrf2 family nitric oxide-sensitive transcriptional repressor
MHITQYTNYALRVLMYLDCNRGPARIIDIAERHQISRNHLIKIVQQLGKHGYVNTTRGKGGGVALARPASEINIGEIVRLTEDSLNLLECFGDVDSKCKLKDICRLQTLFAKALKGFFDVLDEATIADISANRKEIMAALGMAA